MASGNGCLGSRGNVRASGYQNRSGDSDDTFIRPDSRAGQHRPFRLFRDQGTDRRKIAIDHFQELRAMVSAFAPLPPVQSKSSGKHAETLL